MKAFSLSTSSPFFTQSTQILSSASSTSSCNANNCNYSIFEEYSVVLPCSKFKEVGYRFGADGMEYGFDATWVACRRLVYDEFCGLDFGTISCSVCETDLSY
ncbi:hypothetical protein E2542_SST07937 [Spatholobus suberectus]|nr:hypothetical protein E2542_SST07937 [Spatholobus suberectus]